GKWHLGYHPPYLPASHGFDDFRGLASGDGDHHSHIDRSGRRDWWHNDRIEMESGYTADLVTRHAVEFIDRNRTRPFFLYVAHLAIHFPWQGPEDEGYRVEGRSYHDLSKLGSLPGKDVGAKVRAMVENLDRNVGRIVEALERRGLARNTLLFFTSDNGGYLTYSGGYRNISSNGPLRGQKGEVYEGGHRVPAIAWWPGRIKSGVCNQTVMTFDLFPTFAELAGIARQGSQPRPDGLSLTRLLFDWKALEARTLFWRMRENRAVRQGPWKLVRMGAADPQLYNLEQDLGESRDLAAAQPQRVKALLDTLASWEKEVNGRRSSVARKAGE
ncbi:MAG: sulfatase-like hydrolase/transferase, partial [Acidobacteria bacterium]|nr:sulfatase-like hydrolase/transferase [Acidobacteriota bacterium]